MKRPVHADLAAALAALGDAVEKLRRSYIGHAPSIQAAMTGPEPDVKVVSLGGDNPDPDMPSEQIPAAEAGINPRHSVVELHLRMMKNQLDEVLIAYDDCYAHMATKSDFTEWRTNLQTVPFCDWCAYQGKRNIRSAGGWSQGDDGVSLCQPHHFLLMKGMSNDPKLWKHEPIHAWQAAGYPDPIEFLKRWSLEH